MPLFRPRRADQLTTQKIYRKAEKLLQQHWIRADCANADRKKQRWIVETWIAKTWAAKVCDKK
jgi:hypothetical protein